MRKLVGLEHGHLVVVEIDDLRGVLDDRGGVGGDDVFVLAHADDQRRALAGDDERVGLVLADDRDAVGAFDFVQRRLHRALKQRRAGGMSFLRLQFGVEIADQHREHFGVGLAGERVALFVEELLERGVVFDDAVVDQRDLPASSVCGWALTSVGAPWVAQRVWAMPMWASGRPGLSPSTAHLPAR